MPQAKRDEGRLPSGSRYLIEVPHDWNRVLLLVQRPIPGAPSDPVWTRDDLLLRTLVERGFALAGSANTIFWPLEPAFADAPALLETFGRSFGEPQHTIALGLSIGGIMAAGLIQQLPGRLSGALALGGNLAGAVAVHNRELDIGFVVKTLLAPDAPLDLVRIADPEANIRVAMPILREAQATPAGRARLALAAAAGNTPGWFDPDAPEPAPEDAAARVEAQLRWFEEPCFFVYFAARAQVEQQAGGNPSWNVGVDYRELLAGSPGRDEVEALYGEAGLDVGTDLETLDAAPRIDADPGAVAYLERHVVFDGDLGGAPVVAMHTTGDGLVTPDNVRAYADVVDWHGDGDLLRSLFVRRGGHCTFAVSEVLVALEALRERIENGAWGPVDPQTLNTSAAALGLEGGARDPEHRFAPAFCAFEPPAFPRPYDVRSTAAARG